MSAVAARTLDLLDDLVAHGRAAITTAEAADALGIPQDQVRVRMHRYLQQGRVIAPARGLWVPVPPQHRVYGALPGLQMIDLLMRHLGRDYYVGWLSAAEVHGVAHQAPQVLQVAVSAPVQDRTLGRVRLQFATRARVADVPREQRTAPTGLVWVATPATTALDLVDDPARSGGLSNAATVIAELAADGRLTDDALADAARHFPITTVRRLGRLLDSLNLAPLTGGLQRLASEHRRAPITALDRRSPPEGPTDHRWRVAVNTQIDPDL
ncbi:MAG: type IV toxin-antitoxin system AbiEi family antitoxin domain-containing protein [Dermatophilaceae bacterium]